MQQERRPYQPKEVRTPLFANPEWVEKVKTLIEVRPIVKIQMAEQQKRKDYAKRVKRWGKKRNRARPRR